MSGIAAGAIFVALLGLALLVIGALRRDGGRPHLAAQIAQYSQRGAPPAPRADGTVASAAVGWVARMMQSGDAERRLATRLDRAGIARKPAEWALLGACACVLLAAVLAAATGNLPVAIVVGVLGGWLGMRLVLSFRVSRRLAAFGDQLPTVLQLVAGSLRSGFSLVQALDAVVGEEAQPAAGEFGRALAEARLGVALDVALDDVATRMESSDLRWSVMAIRIQREVGGNLAEVLRNTVLTMRERAYLRRQVRALSAEGRLSAYILVAMPLLVGSWLMLTATSYMRPLYTTPAGVAMLAGAGLLLVAGAWWMRKVITVVV